MFVGSKNKGEPKMKTTGSVWTAQFNKLLRKEAHYCCMLMWLEGAEAEKIEALRAEVRKQIAEMEAK
jgi:hypothetical protein